MKVSPVPAFESPGCQQDRVASRQPDSRLDSVFIKRRLMDGWVAGYYEI